VTKKLLILLGVAGWVCTLFSGVCFAEEPSPDVNALFSGRDFCVVISDLSTGKVIREYNPARCAERLSPCSSFKIAAAVMAFEKNILKDDHQVIKWDGIHHDREELNQDQTPYTWMSDSVLWVTAWITPQLGLPTIQKFLSDFSYGNQDFSGSLTRTWVMSTLKISAEEQLTFISKLWKAQLPVSKRAIELTKKIIFIKKIGANTELYGKTGTGCVLGTDCDKKPGRMLGWFVGVLKNGKHEYAFAANATDKDSEKAVAGPRLRETMIRLFQQQGLAQ
jgi:beta-lactamase class D